MAELSIRQRRKASLIEEIDRYLMERENDGDGEAQVLYLLGAAKETLEEGEESGEGEEKTDTTIQSTLEKIQQRLTRIEEQGPRNQEARKHTYAAAAQQGATAARTRVAGEAQRQGQRDLKTTAGNSRRDREITIKIRDSEDQARLLSRPNKEVTEALKATAPAVIGINRLASGDVRITTKTPAERKQLQSDTTWAKVLGESAALTKRTYRVTVPGVRMRAVDTSKQEEAIRHIQSINMGLHHGLRISRVGWSARAIREDRAYSPLSIDVETPAMANQLIREGVLIDFELKYCERYTPPHMASSRCHNCQSYGHFQKACKQAPTCGHCAGKHTSFKCDGKEDAERHRCAACGEKGHRVWSDTCVAKQSARQRAFKAKGNKARIYPAQEDTDAPMEVHHRSTTDAPNKRAASLSAPTTPTGERGRRASSEKENRIRSHSYLSMMDRGMREKAFAKKRAGRPKILAVALTDVTNNTRRENMDTSC